jgi:hypothetical protein
MAAGLGRFGIRRALDPWIRAGLIDANALTLLLMSANPGRHQLLLDCTFRMPGLDPRFPGVDYWRVAGFVTDLGTIRGLSPSEGQQCAVFDFMPAARPRRQLGGGPRGRVIITKGSRGAGDHWDVRLPREWAGLDAASRPPGRAGECVERTAVAMAGAASRIAGPCYSWTSEAWRADLEAGPVGCDQPMTAARKLGYALGLLLFAAPRLRLSGLAWRISGVLRAAWRRVLFSDAAAGLLAGGLLAALVAAIWAESGITGAATFASTGVPAAAWGVRWLRGRATRRQEP